MIVTHFCRKQNETVFRTIFIFCISLNLSTQYNKQALDNFRVVRYIDIGVIYLLSICLRCSLSEIESMRLGIQITIPHKHLCYIPQEFQDSTSGWSHRVLCEIRIRSVPNICISNLVGRLLWTLSLAMRLGQVIKITWYQMFLGQNLRAVS